MRSRLNGLPYEVLSYIIGYISFDDVISLARTSKQLQFLEREEQICKKVLEVRIQFFRQAALLLWPGSSVSMLTELKEKLPFCDEALAAQKAGAGYALALRRVAKRQEAVATANPFSVAMIGFGDHFLYSCGILCYILDENLRILDLRKSAKSEILVSVPRLLQKSLLESEQGNRGRFRVLYCYDSIISCLYTPNSPDSMASLIAFDAEKGAILLACELPSIEKIFVRSNSDFLYYGFYAEEDANGHKKWTLRGYCFEKEEWFSQRVFLGELNGSELGSSICFEIYDGYLYALSNQTNYEIEEVDWTSFYHCVRFPLGSPSKRSLEKTAQDERMWRRQHREGPVDDRWASLALKRDEATGDLKIVECRREFLDGAGRSQRTFYTTKLIFPSKRVDEPVESKPSFTSTSASSVGGISSYTAFEESTISNGNFERHTLAALTNDRLALTLKPSDNPHWLPAQTRFPRDFHRGNDDGSYVYSQTHLKYYNSSAKAFLDLINDPRSTGPFEQRLRLRVGSRKLGPPVRDCYGIVEPEPTDPVTGEILYGLNDRYIDGPIKFWPRDLDNEEDPKAKNPEELYELMNPPGHLGNVEVMGDDRSFVYATGEKNQLKALIFVTFDPNINLGLESWCRKRRLPGGTLYDNFFGENQSHGVDMDAAKDEKLPEKAPLTHLESSQIPALEFGVDPTKGDTTNWIWQHCPMYKYILKGFNFGL